ncbi:2-hydroxymuconate tautomerase [Mycobacterium sp. AMU20-3851]|uniref:2-hydroxymuconate tautomerase n=1 Tax=Mycobacterium sp. AMU20-3851 TaxID=3122055 RepID=UPI00375435A9
MPLVEIDMFRGRTAEQKQHLVSRVTAAVSDSLGVPPDLVTIHLNERSPATVAVGGVLGAESGHDTSDNSAAR